MGLKKLKEAQKSDPKNASINFNLGVLYLGKKDFGAAEKAFTKALLLQTDYPDANYHLGILAEEQKKLKKAANFYRKELKINREHIKAKARLASLLKSYPTLLILNTSDHF